MAAKSRAAAQMIGDFAPRLAELTDHLLFDDIWEHPGLSKRTAA
jgi:4-carboxymuconolactone decarboxylase